MKSKPSPISEVIKTVFHDFEKSKKTSKEDIEALWKELVGDRAFKHSRPQTMRKDVLTVQVDSSSWMQELSMRKRWILKGLKRKLGKDRISEIQFRIGEF